MFGSWSPHRIAWSLRKLSLPIGARDLVLDVGSGSNPHPAADVLLERYLDAKHRYEPLVVDRPTILADGCKMPFRDKAFDFVIAFHVLEHVSDPASFLNELQRVGKAGYIETPNAIFERLVPYDVHLLEVMEVDGSLIIQKKSSAKPDAFLNELQLVQRSQKWHRLFYGKPQLFHVRHLWRDTISFKILNPETSTNWFIEPEVETAGKDTYESSTGGRGLRGSVLSALTRWQRMRKGTADIKNLLVCPECHASLSMTDDQAICQQCDCSYSMRPVPDFNRPAKMQSGSTSLRHTA